jgi:DNA-directed RNA polymerase beta' subunit
MDIKKNKVSTLELLLKQKRSVFVSHIPVASTLLRPQSITADTFYYSSIDKIINTMYRLAENLKNCIPVEKDYILTRLQSKVNTMWDTYFTEINGKDGLIRGEMLGGSLNYTARNVIVPSPDLHDNEVDLSYHTFLEVFKYKIIYYIMKLDDVTLSNAYAQWREASTFNEKTYQIMQYIIEREDTRILINRNPTLNFYSMLLMKIRKVKHDGEDYALSVPLSILPGQL